MNDRKPPKEVMSGLILLTISLLIGAIRAYFIINHNLDAVPVDFKLISTIIILFIISIPIYLLSAFLIYKIYKRKRWARISLLIFFVIGLFLNIENMIGLFLDLPFIILLYGFEYGLTILGLVYLFKSQSSEWFGKKEKKEIITKPKKYRKELLTFVFLIGLLIVFLYLISTNNPQELVEKVGIKNGYIIAFLASFLAGFSAVTTAIAYSIIGTLIAGGLNPLLLGLIGGLSLSMGDMLMFYIGSKGRRLVTGKYDKEIEYLSNKIKNSKAEKFMPLIAYIYIAFTPLPNDWLILFLASIEYPPNKTYKIIVLGDFTLMLVFTLLVTQGIGIFG